MSSYKFYPVNKKGTLAVALESSIGEMKIEDCLKNGCVEEITVYDAGQEKRIYHPATITSGKIVFKIITKKEIFKRLVFRAKSCRAIAGRFGEEKPFGFDKLRSKSVGADYIALAYPGITGEFARTYFITKIPMEILEVSAVDSENGVEINIKHINSAALPQNMRRVLTTV